MTTTQEFRTFVGAAARRPGLIGAVVPTGVTLGAQLAAVIPGNGKPTVVELGAGTGAISSVIRDRMPVAGRQLAVELNSDMASYLRERHPWLTLLEGDARDLAALLAEAGVTQVDAVIGSLPWSMFTLAEQQRLVDAVCEVLAPDGVFATVGYLHAMRVPGARRFRTVLRRRFDEMLITRAIWANIPPAQVYVCRRPDKDA